MIPEALDPPLSAATPLGDSVLLKFICRKCVVNLDDIHSNVDLIVILMSEFDVILDMNWLSSYHVSINHFVKTVCLRVPGRVELVVATSRGNLSAEAYLANIEKVTRWVRVIL